MKTNGPLNPESMIIAVSNMRPRIVLAGSPIKTKADRIARYHCMFVTLAKISALLGRSKYAPINQIRVRRFGINRTKRVLHKNRAGAILKKMAKMLKNNGAKYSGKACDVIAMSREMV